MKKTNTILHTAWLLTVMLLTALAAQAQTTAFSQDFTGSSTDPADYGFAVTGTTTDQMSASVTDGKLVLVSGQYGNSRGYDAKASFTAIPSGNEITFSCSWATGSATGNNNNDGSAGSYSALILSDGTNKALDIRYCGQDKYLMVNGTRVKESVERDKTYNVSVTINTTTKKITALSVGDLYTIAEAIGYYSSDCADISTFQFSHWSRSGSWVNTSSIDNVSIVYEEIVIPDMKVTAFSQDFTAIGESTSPSDYGFELSYGAGSSSSLVNFSVTDGVLQCVAGPYASSSAGARTGTATATFDAIGSTNEVTLTYVWALGSATGNASGSYTKTCIGNGSGRALELSFYGSESNGSLKVNGTTVMSGKTAIRNTTYTVAATLNLFSQKITALSLTCSNTTFNYELAEPIGFASAISSIDRFEFENSERQNWSNTSSIDNVLVRYEELPTPEAIRSVSIEGATSMTFGADPNTAYSNPFSVTIKGEDGTTITEENLNEMVKDFSIVWDIEGFKTENDTEGQYCDSYGAFSDNGQGKVATTFDLKNVPMNFYGKMTATITYFGNTYVAEKYVVALGDLSRAANQVLPLAGYPKSFSAYNDALTGYSCVEETNGGASDLILGGWCLAGSDSGKSAILRADGDGTKYVRITAANASKSHVMTKTITTPTSQFIFKNRLRFNNTGGTMTLTSRYPFWSSATGYTNPVTLTFSGTKIVLNNKELTLNNAAVNFATGTWYDVVLSVDKTTETCYALVYNTSGTLLAESGSIAWNETSSPTFFSIGMGNSNTGSIDVASCEAFTPAVDADSYTLTADKTTLSIPNNETVTLTATVSDANGYAITQTATWTVLEDDMREFVTVTPSESDSHVATVSLSEGVEAGTATVQVSIGGVTKTIALTLTSSAESVKFTQSTTSITIPLDEGETATAQFTAIVVNGSGADMERTVTLAAYENDGTTAYANTDAVSFNAATGVLSVKGTASPMQLVIVAMGKNSDNDDLTKTVRVNIHGMKFDFGFTGDDAVAEGFTLVGPSTSYTSVNGYGIKSGTAVAGGTDNASDATADYLEGAIEFDFKATIGEFYTIEITYQGTLTTGYINSDLAGYQLGSSETMTTATFTIPATTEVVDLRIANTEAGAKARIAQVTVTKQVKRTKKAKPTVHHIGDSTSANNGSWAYRLKNLISGTYPELAALCDFENNGAGGRNLSTYYTQGRLASVLRDIYPGDIVMFGNNGTNGMGSSFEADVNYYLNAAEALGAKVIINSYTPHGAVSAYASGYNSSTHTFDSYRRDSYDVTVRSVAEERAESDANYLGFVEIGKNADAAFNAYVADYAANGYANADAAAQAIIDCFTDHNHYSNGTLACDLMLNGYGSVKGIVAQLVELLSLNSKTISAWGWNTYSSRYAVTFGEGTAAYIVTATDESSATLKEVSSVPAYTGVLISGTPNAVAAIEKTDGQTDDVTANLLRSTASGAVSISSGYVLSATADEGSLGFYRLTSAKTVPQYNAYLPADAVGASSRSMLMFSFGDNEPTGISTVDHSEKKADGFFYNLRGQRVVSPQKGLYVVNGKKVIIK